ncbi:uncharacterized protein LOC133189577 [Saccostrea echinata]|uniref:uncharacterized protein LOC133189577 n=1 Tax=Saccostrea echinata TaxID=191078 RepID=UPI002A8316EC|nr:uncharacterized protein LOC133189577 [Saccostrea echinata]
MPNRREEHGIQKQQTVTSRCLAIVLKFENGDRCESDVKEEGFSGRDILDDFKLRNKSCYWNPALLESINSLEYLGFVSPCTLLVGGSELHLENIRTAWGRRVLNDPSDFSIQSIGDVDGINMEVIPQTQFVPLSEILCMVILELNNKQVVATLDTIQERLNQCYKGMQIPSPPLIYDTLGTLIRERKIFHTGSGYFVVTSDTYRMPEDPTKTIPLSWLHYNPNYIPVLNSSAKGLTRTISCQVTLANEPRKKQSEKSSDPDDKIVEMRHNLERETLERQNQPLADKPRLGRSLSARRQREKGPVKNDDLRDFKRSLSVRRQDEKEKKHTQEERKSAEDIAITKNSSKKNKDKGEKKSLLAKLFGRKKKKTDTPKEQPKKVEYATFSDQFPPPEWGWYQDQVEKQQRIHKWMQQVPHHPHVHHQHYDRVHPIHQGHPHHSDYHSVRFGHGPIRNDVIYGRHVPQHENHYHVPPRMKLRNNPPPPLDDDYEEIQDVDANSRFRSTLPAHHHHPQEVEHHRRMSEGRHTMRRKEKSKRMSLDRRVDRDYENVPMCSNYPSPAFPYHTESSHNMHHNSHPVTHPLYSSTPRVPGMWQQAHESYYPQVNAEEVHQHQCTTQKSKKKSHRRHGQSNHRQMEEHYRLPAKNTSISISHDSGVNLIGLQTVHYKPSQDTHHRRRVHDDMSIRNNLRNDPYGDLDEDLPNSSGQVVYEVEINKRPEPRTRENEYVTMETDSKKDNEKKRNSCNSDSALTFSEQSCDTVIKKEDKDVEDITKETLEVVLGDSGFSSPRVCDESSPEMEKQKIKSKVKELEKGSHSDLCDKNVYQKSDDSSPEMRESRSSDKENRINMINNLKQVQGDYGVLTHVNPVSGRIPLYPQNTIIQPVQRKFSFEDDYGFL